METDFGRFFRRSFSFAGACCLWGRRVYVFPIRLYQRFISPILRPGCRFYPSCSSYAIEAVMVHGIVKGSLLTAWRLLRCNPWSEGGYDPVPVRPARASFPDAVPASSSRGPADDPAGRHFPNSRSH